MAHSKGEKRKSFATLEDHDNEPRRSNRTNLGKNGQVEQLQKVSSALEKRTSRRHQVAVIADGVPINPMAPAETSGRRRAKRARIASEVLPYLYVYHFL